MENKFYVLIDKDRIDGPFKFRESERERNWWYRFGSSAKILKLVIDENGKEVK